MKEGAGWAKDGVIARLNDYMFDDLWLAARGWAEVDPAGFKQMAESLSAPRKMGMFEMGPILLDGVKDYYVHEQLRQAIEDREAKEA